MTKLTVPNAIRNAEQQDHLIIADGSIKWYNLFGVSLKVS